MSWLNKYDRPVYIAGPCSAETEEQVIRTAVDLNATGKVDVLRAGIWKPRTRPNSFEGIGSVGLEWLVNAGKETGLKVTTEVANTKHVELALNAGIDILWVGARTTVNPFTVQEIADALQGTNIPVMIKNPVNPDLQLWLGAFERFEKNGVTDLIGIHRGFSVYNHAKYRNVPNWEIPIALKEHRPETKVICDPSHITGNRDLLLEVSQKALDLNFDGLMIETHPDPVNAWSDSSQQLTPKHWGELIDQLILRTTELPKDVEQLINDLRLDVSTIDDRIFDLLRERMLLSEEVGKLKRENSITILQQEHWRKIINSRLAESSEYNLTPQFVRKVMDSIHQESIRHQTRIMNLNK